MSVILKAPSFAATMLRLKQAGRDPLREFAEVNEKLLQKFPSFSWDAEKDIVFYIGWEKTKSEVQERYDKYIGVLEAEILALEKKLVIGKVQRSKSLRDLRAERGMTQVQLAEKAKVYPTLIRKLENQEIRIENVALLNAFGIAQALGITVEELALALACADGVPTRQTSTKATWN